MQVIVSICVVTYNNGKYVEETLDSIKNQTYKDIELIISDDNSTDDTLLKVNKWVEKNKERFENVKIITSDKNTGVTANCNRAVKACAGQFVKPFGDDILKTNYVEECVKFFHANPEAEVLCTEMEYFYPEEKFEFMQPAIDFDFFRLSAQEQKKYVKYKNIPQYPTPSVIYKRDIFDKVGFFDESIPMWEDGPMYFKLAKNEIKVYMLNEKLVNYRLLRKSLSNNVTKVVKKNIALYWIKYTFPFQFPVKPIRSLSRLVINFIRLIINYR